MSNRMWTSTRNTKFSYSWYYDINIQGDHLSTGSRDSSHYVRPFLRQLSAARSLFLLVRFRPLQPHCKNLYLFFVVETDLME